MMMEEVAYTFHFQPSELVKFNMRKLRQWHSAATRINKRMERH